MFSQQPGFDLHRSDHDGMADRAHVSQYTWLYDGCGSAVDRIAILGTAVQLSSSAELPGWL
jgi:hypothetical protein